MKNRITKNVKSELKNILDSTGYWSDETRNYIGQFEYTTARKLHQMAQVYIKYNEGL